jgi:phage shock protein B
VEEAVAIGLVVFVVVVLPLVVILHYVTKWKSTKGLSIEEQQMLEDLWEGSERIQRRLDVLETILDEKSAEWRSHD